MSTKETGGPAFPCTPEHSVRMNGEGGVGMSLRDYFAAQALPVAWHAESNWYFEGKDWGDTNQKVATAAYQIADAMLAARSA